MNWQIFIPTILASLFALIGWIIVHRFNSERDLKNKQRELRIKYIIEAYSIFTELGRNKNILGNYKEVERAIHNIQLLGTPKQIELCKKFVVEIVEEGKTDHTDLTIELRNFVRKELGLTVIDRKLISLIITPTDQDKKHHPELKSKIDITEGYKF